MQNPYDKYKKTHNPNMVHPGNKSKPIKNGTSVKGRLSKRHSIKKSKSSNSLPIVWILSSFMGLAASFYVVNYTDQFLSLMTRIQIQFTSAVASEGEKSSSESSKMEAKKSTNERVGSAKTLSGDESLTMENASVYKALRDKEKNLEVKALELARLEEDLHKQKEEIEKQLGELVEMRRSISSKIDTKVLADQESIDKLVGVYADMKPQSAALVITQIDEDLAVKVLGQMKKQNAAAILNFMEPGKAQLLSEKYAGLKK